MGGHIRRDDEFAEHHRVGRAVRDVGQAGFREDVKDPIEFGAAVRPARAVERRGAGTGSVIAVEPLLVRGARPARQRLRIRRVGRAHEDRQDGLVVRVVDDVRGALRQVGFNFVMESLLLNEGKHVSDCPVAPVPLIARVIANRIAVPQREPAVGRVVIVQAECELLQIVLAFETAGGFAYFLHRRQQ